MLDLVEFVALWSAARAAASCHPAASLELHAATAWCVMGFFMDAAGV